MKPLPIIAFPDDPARQAQHETEVQWCRDNLTQQEIDRLAIAAVDVFTERCKEEGSAAA